MKRIINKMVRGQEGQTLIIVLVLLLVGGLIVAPLLSYMYTGLKVGKDVYEEGMLQLYAADAGVEYGLHQIVIKADDLPQSPGDPAWTGNIIDINGKYVDPIIVNSYSDIIYSINSTATDIASSSSSNIISYIRILSFHPFIDNAITSLNDVDIQPGSTVIGSIQYNGEIDLPPPDPDITWDLNTDNITNWPEEEDLILWYWPDVSSLIPCPDDTIDLKDVTYISYNGTYEEDCGLYRDGELTITNKGSSGAEGHLLGTVYITGDLEFKQTGNKDYHIYLDGHTIFVLGNINFPSDRCTLHGPGCIVAIGDINFQPQMASVDDPEDMDLIFVMSVEGTTNFQPNGDFYGSIAGDVEVNLQPGCSLTWNGPPPTLNYPGSEPSDKNVIQDIISWIITRQ